MRTLDWWLAVFVAALMLAVALPLLPGGSGARESLSQDAQSAQSVEWAQPEWAPRHASPRRLPLSEVEQRFARRFPGHIGRFAHGGSEWIVRVIDEPTRMLHPADDCFRGLGYETSVPRVHVDARGDAWRCFIADGKQGRLKVCERIFDTHGGRWTDTSSWYWSALLGPARAGGPWWAVTRVERAD